MTETPDPAKRPADAERSSSLREWRIDALALAMGGLAIYHYRPEGFLGGTMSACKEDRISLCHKIIKQVCLCFVSWP